VHLYHFTYDFFAVHYVASSGFIFKKNL